MKSHMSTLDEHLRILRLGAEGNLPEVLDRQSGVSLHIVEELIGAGYIAAVDVSTIDGPGFMQPRITLAGREYLHQSETGEPVQRASGMSIRLFVSHSSQDASFVRLLVGLLRSALQLPAQQIRCTSVDGFRLPGGANTNEQLRAEVYDAEAFIGVISAHSISSLYVAFELGARWGAGKQLIPLLAPGADVGLLGGPLSALNALRSDIRPQLQQLVADVGAVLAITPESPHAYDADVEAILASPRGTSTNRSASTPASLSEKEVEILQVVAQAGDYTLTDHAIATELKENLVRTQYWLNRLVKVEYLHDMLSTLAPTTYGLQEKGRAYLVENGLL
jgi:hypothetical protein